MVDLADELQDAMTETERYIDDLEIRAARKNLGHFAEYVITDSQTNLPIKLWQGHWEWIKHITRWWAPGANIGILAPTGHGKSAIAATSLPLFVLGLDQRLRIGIVCNSDNNAEARITSCGEYIKTSERYHRVFPQVTSDPARAWNTQRLFIRRPTISNEASLNAYAIGSRRTGARVDILIGDDVIDLDDRLSLKVRLERIQRWKGVWSKRREPNGVTVFICTPWADGDLRDELMDLGHWHWLVQGVNEDLTAIEQPPKEPANLYCNRPNVANADSPIDIPLWDRWTQKALEEDQAESAELFNMTKRMLPSNPEAIIFDLDKVDAACRWNLAVEDIVPFDNEGLPEWPCWTGVDLSGEGRPGCALFTFCRAPMNAPTHVRGKNIVMDIRVGAWGMDVKMVEQIYEVDAAFRPIVIAIENNFLQKRCVEWYKEKYGTAVNVRGIHTGKTKLDPASGVPGLAIQVANDGWIIPMKHIADHRPKRARCPCGYCRLIREMTSYQTGSESSHDVLMAWWQATRVASRSKTPKAPPLMETGESRIFGGVARVFNTLPMPQV